MDNVNISMPHWSICWELYLLNWQEWVTTLTHAYNCNVSTVTGFSPYFVMFGQTPKIPLDIEMGVTLMGQGDMSYQNYVKKVKARLKWAYQIAQENNQKESEHHKKYYDKRVRCLSLKPDDLVLVHVKAPSGDHKIADKGRNFTSSAQLTSWSTSFWVQPVDAVGDENIKVLHRNILFPVQSPKELDSVIVNNGEHFALMKANLLMDLHFNNWNWSGK